MRFSRSRGILGDRGWLRSVKSGGSRSRRSVARSSETWTLLRGNVQFRKSGLERGNVARTLFSLSTSFPFPLTSFALFVSGFFHPAPRCIPRFFALSASSTLLSLRSLSSFLRCRSCSRVSEFEVEAKEKVVGTVRVACFEEVAEAGRGAGIA